MKYACLLIPLSLFMGCNRPSADRSLEAGFLSSEVAVKDPEVVRIFCHGCHNPSAASHDAILAPPLRVVRDRYRQRYPDKQRFRQAIADFVTHPDVDKVIMFGAYRRFGLMPAMALDSARLHEIAEFLYNTTPEEPVWLAEEMRRQGFN